MLERVGSRRFTGNQSNLSGGPLFFELEFFDDPVAVAEHRFRTAVDAGLRSAYGGFVVFRADRHSGSDRTTVGTKNVQPVFMRQRLPCRVWKDVQPLDQFHALGETQPAPFHVQEVAAQAGIGFIAGAPRAIFGVRKALAESFAEVLKHLTRP